MLKSAAGTVGKVAMVAQTGVKNGAGNGSEHSTRPQPAAGSGNYPSARFINGEFRAQNFSDEALLYALAE